jgi:hypothetical protein
MADDRLFFWPSALAFGDGMIRIMPNGPIRTLELGILFIGGWRCGFQ